MCLFFGPNKHGHCHPITPTDTPLCHVITASHLTAFQDLYDFAALPPVRGNQKKKKEKRKGKKRRRALWARRDGGHYGRGG